MQHSNVYKVRYALATNGEMLSGPVWIVAKNFAAANALAHGIRNDVRGPTAVYRECTVVDIALVAEDAVTGTGGED